MGENIVDLSKARPGSEVTFRCGSSAVIRDIWGERPTFKVGFEGYEENHRYQTDGTWFPKHVSLLDIISIVPPPLTEAERLAEIVKILRVDMGNTDRGEVWVHCTRASRILALAEGRSHD